MTGVRAAADSATIDSECAPQPWSAETTPPSSGAYAFAQAPNSRPSSPLSGTKKPQLMQCAGAAFASGVRGPCSLSYQRSAAPSRPMADSTRVRPGAGSSDGSAGPASGSPGPESGPSSNQSTTASSPSTATSGTRRSSSGGAGSRSPTPRSPGRSRSCHGTQSGASSEPGPGSSTVSLTVTTLARGPRTTVTAHLQPV